MTMLRWLSALLACFPFFCSPAPEVGADEFCLQVTVAAPGVYGLYTEYGLLDDCLGDMGVRNADGSAFARNDVLFLTFDQELIPADSDLSGFSMLLYWIGPEGETTPVTGLLTWPAAWGETYAASLRLGEDGNCFLETAFPCSVLPFP